MNAGETQTDRTARWIEAGIVAGALAGVVDAGLAIAGGIGGLTVAKALRLVAVGASLLAAAGGVAGALIALCAAVVARRRNPERSAASLAAVVAAPLVFYDAFALFVGPRAARVPAHGIVSVVLGVGGCFAVYGLARAFWRRCAAPPGRGTKLAAAALFAVGLALELANRLILPRLYGWFHATLAAATLLVFVFGGRLLWVGRRVSRWRWAVLAVVAAGGFAGALVTLRTSQVMRYAAHERTALSAVVLRGVPAALEPHTVAAGERHAAEAELPPLPQGPSRPEADVLLITIDALRSDHVGAYGYARRTTPHIDALAAEGTRFSRAYSQAPHTSFSVTSMLTGKYFPTLARLAPEERHEPIAAVLRHYGWRTAAFYPPAVFYVDAQKTKVYADTNFDFEYVKFEYLDAQKRVDQILAYYDQVKPQRSFVWVHFFEPHEPYVAHAGFEFGAGDIDRYDSEIAYTDAAVGRLIAAVRARRPGTIIVLGADHGEEFDEHGGRYHGSTLYDEQLHIPLIISIPGVTPHVVDGPVQLIDVTPTVLNLLDIPVPARMRGTDLGPWLARPPAPTSRLPPAFAEVEDKRMVVSGTEKLLCDLHWGFCAYYDLAADPHEQHNLAEERPDRAAAMRALLDEWLDGHVRLEPLLAKGSASPEGGPPPKAIERGRLGDLLAAPGLAALMRSPSAPLSQRREAAELLVGLPPRRETGDALAQATGDPDRMIADWAAVGAARLGDAAARPRVSALVADPAAAPKLRVRAALALAGLGDASGIDVLGGALDHCDDVLLCRTIIITLGKLGDRRATPILLAHLGEVQNRREMVEALGAIADPAAVDALLGRLRGDEYVPVRIQAAKALAEIGKRNGDSEMAARIEQATRRETEPNVVAAARGAAASLRTN